MWWYTHMTVLKSLKQQDMSLRQPWVVTMQDEGADSLHDFRLSRSLDTSKAWFIENTYM